MDIKAILEDLLSRLSSRKFILVFGLILVLLADNTGLKIDPAIRDALLKLVLGYVVIEGAKDSIVALKS